MQAEAARLTLTHRLGLAAQEYPLQAADDLAVRAY